MIDRILEAICALILALMVGVAFVSVIFRYVLGSSLSWSFEASLALLSYLTFVGCYLALRKGAHLKVDVLVQRMPVTAQLLCFVANQIMMIGIGAIMTWEGGRLTSLFYAQKTLVLEIPRGVLYVMVPLTGALIAIDGVVWLVGGIKSHRRGEPLFPSADKLSIDI